MYNLLMYNLLEPFRRRYFYDVASVIPQFRGQFIVLTHMLPDRPELLSAIESIAPIAFLIAIPYSVHQPTLEHLKKQYRISTPSLDELFDSKFMCNLIGTIEPKKELIILEIGGYFAPVLEEVRALLGHRLIGVIESTESGHRQYERVRLPCPVVSVSRGSLKKAEYSLVGTSCVFSTETLIRRAGFLLDGKNTAILGYGKVGRGLAQGLIRRHCQVFIYDTNSVVRMLALSEGYRAPEKADIFVQAEVIFGASGHESIAANDFQYIKNGAVLVSCSSKNIEFDLAYLQEKYERTNIFENFDLYRRGEQYFYLLGRGMPINFLDGAVMGPILALVQAEILYAIKVVIDLKHEKGLFEVNEDDRQMLAKKWLTYFYDKSVGHYENSWESS